MLRSTPFARTTLFMTAGGRFVRLEGDDRRHVGQIGTHFGVMRQHIADDKKVFAGHVCFVDCVAQRFDVAEFVVAHAQAVAWLAGIDGIGAEGEGRAHHGQRAGRREQFRGGRCLGGCGIRHGGLGEWKQKSGEGRGRRDEVNRAKGRLECGQAKF